VLFDEILLCKKQSSSKTIKLCVLYFDFVEKNGKLKLHIVGAFGIKPLVLLRKTKAMNIDIQNKPCMR